MDWAARPIVVKLSTIPKFYSLSAESRTLIFAHAPRIPREVRGKFFLNFTAMGFTAQQQGYSASKIAAAPMPVPIHIVTIP